MYYWQLWLSACWHTIEFQQYTAWQLSVKQQNVKIWVGWLDGLGFWDGEHILSSALELILLSDYWLPYIGDEFDLVVFAKVGLIITVLKKSLLLLITSMDSVMDPHNPIFAYVNLHKLFYIPIIWLVLFSVNYDETFVFERGPTHFYVLITIIWYPAVSL